jgi:hypothetical protein
MHIIFVIICFITLNMHQTVFASYILSAEDSVLLGEIKNVKTRDDEFSAAFSYMVKDSSEEGMDLMILQGEKKSRVCGVDKPSFVVDFYRENYLIDKFLVHNTILCMPHIHKFKPYTLSGDKIYQDTQIDLMIHVLMTDGHHITQQITMPIGFEFSKASFKDDVTLEVNVERKIPAGSYSLFLKLPLAYTLAQCTMSADQVFSFLKPNNLFDLLLCCGYFQVDFDEQTRKLKAPIFVLNLDAKLAEERASLAQGVYALLNVLTVPEGLPGRQNFEYVLDTNAIGDDDVASVLQVLTLLPNVNLSEREKITNNLLINFIWLNGIKLKTIGTLPKGWDCNWCGAVISDGAYKISSKEEGKKLLDSIKKSPLFTEMKDAENAEEYLKTNLQNYLDAHFRLCIEDNSENMVHLTLNNDDTATVCASYNTGVLLFTLWNVTPEIFAKIGTKSSLKMFFMSKFTIATDDCLFFFLPKDGTGHTLQQIPNDNLKDYGYQDDYFWTESSLKRTGFLKWFYDSRSIYTLAEHSLMQGANELKCANIQYLNRTGKFCLCLGFIMLFVGGYYWNHLSRFIPIHIL